MKNIQSQLTTKKAASMLQNSKRDSGLFETAFLMMTIQKQLIIQPIENRVSSIFNDVKGMQKQAFAFLQQNRTIIIKWSLKPVLQLLDY
ncbi:hypothetical protein [Evansella halocellulosilytica]|uniref:hypothetical protein n=1 Tax=Evansella halocellulosilytica TaxID=2011013 RepID=UPI000BB73D57|nr:hypothetical protein [Evansella halocellulosilytica]